MVAGSCTQLLKFPCWISFLTELILNYWNSECTLLIMSAPQLHFSTVAKCLRLLAFVTPTGQAEKEAHFRRKETDWRICSHSDKIRAGICVTFLAMVGRAAVLLQQEEVNQTPSGPLVTVCGLCLAWDANCVLMPHHGLREVGTSGPFKPTAALHAHKHHRPPSFDFPVFSGTDKSHVQAFAWTYEHMHAIPALLCPWASQLLFRSLHD